MQTIRTRYPARRRIPLVMDNLSTHWTDAIRSWAAESNVELVPTPTYASFLSRIECHFSEIGEFVIKNADYPDRDTLAKAMADYIHLRNRTPGGGPIAQIETAAASRDQTPSPCDLIARSTSQESCGGERSTGPVVLRSLDHVGGSLEEVVGDQDVGDTRSGRAFPIGRAPGNARARTNCGKARQIVPEQRIRAVRQRRGPLGLITQRVTGDAEEPRLVLHGTAVRDDGAGAEDKRDVLGVQAPVDGLHPRR
jgi:DDE superfamily endonuclease